MIEYPLNYIQATYVETWGGQYPAFLDSEALGVVL